MLYRSLENKSLSIRRAAARNGVARSSLTNRLNGIPEKRKAYENQQRVSSYTEARLSAWIRQMDMKGHAPTPKQTREMVTILFRRAGDTAPLE